MQHQAPVGDIVDGWRLGSKWYWPAEHNEILQLLLRAARRGVRVVYIPGNHDAFLREFYGIHFGGIEVVEEAVHVAADGTASALREEVAVLAGEVIDAAVMRRASLETFLAAQVAEARREGVLFSVHVKATMMKVSDPIIFGYAVRAYFADLFDEHGAALASVGVNPNDGLGALIRSAERLPEQLPEEVKEARRGALMEIQQEVAFAHARKQVGKEVEMIVDGPDPEVPGHVLARTAADAPDIDCLVRLKGKNLEPGHLVRGRITGADGYDLMARAIRAR